MKHRLELVLRFVFEIFLSTGLFAVIFGAAFGLEKLVGWLHVHGLSPELAFIARIGEFILLAADLDCANCMNCALNT